MDSRAAVVLRREFGVTHSPQHVGTLLQQCGWSRQQPLRRARQRDEVAINGPLAVRFLKHLLRWIDERLLVIWDGSPIHRSRVVKEWLRQTDGRVWLERLPGYAPDLNPDEAVWNHLKHVQLANVCSPDLSTHRQELLNAIRRFRRREDLIPAFFKAPGL